MHASRPDGPRAWSIAALLFCFSIVNYLDKLVMGLAGVPIMQEFHLSPSQYGALGSSFYALYAVSGLLIGLLAVQRLSTKWLLTALVLIWTIAQFPIVFGSTLFALYAGRILLGVGEGPATPSAYHALYGWFSNTKRNLPTSLLLAGIGTGFLAGSPLLTAVIAGWGWRTGFLACGISGAAWMIAWAVLGADGPLNRPAAADEQVMGRVPWGRFWSDATVVANLVLAGCCYWMTGLSITWLAPYLQIGLGYSPRDTGWLVSIILGSQVVVQVALSFLSQRMLAAGWSSRISRGVVTGSAVVVAGLALVLATVVAGAALRVGLLAAAFTLPQVAFVIGPAIVAEVAPPSQRGTALLVTYSVITVTGLLAPIVTGWVVEAASGAVLVGYTNALWLTAGILVFGGIWGIARLDPEATRHRFARLPVPQPAATATSLSVYSGGL